MKENLKEVLAELVIKMCRLYHTPNSKRTVDEVIEDTMSESPVYISISTARKIVLRDIIKRWPSHTVIRKEIGYIR